MKPFKLNIDSDDEVVSITEWQDNIAIGTRKCLIHMTGEKPKKYTLEEGALMSGMVCLKPSKYRENLYGLINDEVCQLYPEKGILRAGVIDSLPGRYSHIGATRDGKTFVTTDREKSIVWKFENQKFVQRGTEKGRFFAFGYRDYKPVDSRCYAMVEDGQIINGGPLFQLYPAGEDLYMF